MVIFAGSYISTIVQSGSGEIIEDLPVETNVREVMDIRTDVTDAVSTSTVTDIVTSAVSSYSTSVSETTVLPETTVPETEESVTEEETEITEITEEEETEAAETDPVSTQKPSGSSGGNYNYEAPVPYSGQVRSSDYYDKCAFVGDSHTNGLGAYGYVDKSRVFAKDGLSISNIQQSISPSSIAAVSPENVYIMMGTNGVAWLRASDMISSYEEFVDQIVAQIPGVRIYILSIPPVSYERSTTDDAKKNISMDKIREYNSGLQDMAARNEWYFVDTFSEICGPSGYLEGSTDGVHMNKELYNKFTDYILSHTVE